VADLSLYCTAASGTPQASLYHGNNDNWTESTLTWNNQPYFDFSSLDSQAPVADTWTTWDLLAGSWDYSADLADNTLTLAIDLQSAGQAASWYSKESSDASYWPVLSITTIEESPATYSRYDYTFTYAEGDYYSGSVYAATGYSGYGVGYTQTATDEYGQTGTYTITWETGLGSDGSLEGQVFVDSYYDHESDANYLPVHQGAAVGAYYLGSESDYIIQDGVAPYFFGTSGYTYEADVINMTDLGTFGGNTSVAYSINNLGQIVGSAGTADWFDHAFVYDSATQTMTDLGTLFGDSSYAHDINNQGQIVGYYVDASGYDQAFAYDLATQILTPLAISGAIRSYANGINDSGQIVGYYETADYYDHAYVYDLSSQTLTDLGSLGGNYSYAYDINDQGQIVGSSSTSAGELHAFIYDLRSSEPTMTDLNLGASYSVAQGINDAGQIAGYAQTSGYYDLAYVYDLTTQTMTDLPTLGGYYSQAWSINELGQIVGYADTAAYESHAFRYDLSSLTLTDLGALGGTSSSAYAINDLGQVVGAAATNTTSEGGDPHAFLYPAATVSQYEFTFTYGNGDYYTGYAYAETGYDGYQVGYTQEVTDENGLLGTYEITGAQSGSYDELIGQVFVDSYYDQEANQVFTPVDAGAALGTDYLGSEHAYIIQSGITDYLFGRSGDPFYEADLVAYAYDFTFTYGNGDYYTGTVYAAPEYGYSTSYSKSVTDENGKTGAYGITKVTTGYDYSLAGQVYVTSYYDQESGQTYTPVSRGTTVGTTYLGSEQDYIIQSGIPTYLFGSSGGTFYEADLAAYAYSFKFTYGNGDYYTGTVYAAPEYGYSTSYTKSITDENGKTGAYGITKVTTGYDYSLAGQVYVTSYYDQESDQTYIPVSRGSAAGSSYLGSEHAYIIQSGITDYLFGSSGGAFYEADLAAYAYSFKFTYGNGDYYTGTVYAAPEYGYSTSYTKSVTDENGKTGAYGITKVTTGQALSTKGQVYVSSYYDMASGKTYTPLHSGTTVGSSYLGSERDYIIASGVSEFYFGGGYYVADVGSYSRYDFKYYYGPDSRDYYLGYFYAPTSFQTSGPAIQAGSSIYKQPMELWAGGYESLYGGYYSITAVTEGYAASYDKKSYITAFYDGDTAGTSLQTLSATGGTVYVANRTSGWESGYVKSGSQNQSFDPYTEAYGNYSRYAYTFYYSPGGMDYYSSGDYYTGFFYAPTSFQSGALKLVVGKKLYDQPSELWASGSKSLNGGYYEITAITNGFDSSFDKQSYTTAYYDADMAGTSLGVNRYRTTTPGTVHVADRTAAWEIGFASSGSLYAGFDPYHEANITAFSTTSVSAAECQATWGAYWSMTGSLLKEQ
jgi:probable HAF family extracellular repeat protein